MELILFFSEFLNLKTSQEGHVKLAIQMLFVCQSIHSSLKEIEKAWNPNFVAAWVMMANWLR